MKNYMIGIVMGIISIISALMFVGIPIGTNIMEIFMIIFYVIGLLLILYFGMIKKSDRNTFISIIIYIIGLVIFVFGIESNCKDFILVSIGFIPSLVIGITGLFLSNRYKDQYKVKSSFVLNMIGVVLSIISLFMGIFSNNFIMK